MNYTKFNAQTREIVDAYIIMTKYHGKYHGVEHNYNALALVSKMLEDGIAPSTLLDSVERYQTVIRKREYYGYRNLMHATDSFFRYAYKSYLPDTMAINGYHVDPNDSTSRVIAEYALMLGFQQTDVIDLATGDMHREVGKKILRYGEDIVRGKIYEYMHNRIKKRSKGYHRSLAGIIGSIDKRSKPYSGKLHKYTPEYVNDMFYSLGAEGGDIVKPAAVIKAVPAVVKKTYKWVLFVEGETPVIANMATELTVEEVIIQMAERLGDRLHDSNRETMRVTHAVNVSTDETFNAMFSPSVVWVW